MLTLLWLFYFAFPLLVIALTNRYSFLNKVGSIVLVYIVGILMGNVGILPESFAQSQALITNITIPIAIPLLIFTFDIRKWLKMAKTTILSLVITVFSVVLIVAISTLIFNDHSEEYWKIPGLLIGVYTGGTPNLAAIKTALNVSNETYLLTHTFDMVFSSVYLLFLMVLGQPLLSRFLPKYQPINHSISEVEEEKPFQDFFKKSSIVAYSKAFFFAVIILIITALMSEQVKQDNSMLVAILTITTLGIAGSFLPFINRLKKSFDLGMYFILVFSLTVASMADFSIFSTASFNLFFNIGFVVFGSVVLQLIFAKIFKIDSDTTIITSTALICSPPFVPVMAGAIKNKEIIFSGLTIGLVGYAIGNYLGIFFAYLLR